MLTAADQPSTLALKEWGAAVAALLDGRQTVLLRKGGIHEKAFTVRGGDGARFVLFPTVAHSHAERVRPEHRDVLEVGASDVDEQAGTFVVRCGAAVVDAVPVARPEGIEALSDLHIWTSEHIAEDRLGFRPKHALQVLVVQAVALPEPELLERTPEYAGCTSWVDLPVGWDGAAGRPVHDRATLDDVAAAVRAAVA